MALFSGLLHAIVIYIITRYLIIGFKKYFNANTNRKEAMTIYFFIATLRVIHLLEQNTQFYIVLGISITMFLAYFLIRDITDPTEKVIK